MKLLQWFKNVYTSSILGRVGKQVAKAYRSSRIFSIYTAGNVDDSLCSSVLLTSDRHRSFSTGLILPALQKLGNQFLNISLQQAAIIILFWCLSVACASVLDASYRQSLVFGLLMLLIFPLCFVKASVRSVLANSLIGRFFEMDKGQGSVAQNRWFLLLIGALAIVGGMFLSPIYSVLLALLPIAIILLFYVKPIFFITLILICLPIFGTSVCIVLSILLLLSHWLQRISGQVQGRKIDYVDILFSVYPVLCVIASAFSYAPGDSFRVSLMWVILFSGVFLIYRNISSVRDLVISLTGLMLGTFAAGAIGLYQYFSGQVDMTWTDTTLFEDLNLRVYSTFANPNVFGEFLLLAVPIAVGLGLYFTKWKYKIACFALSVVSMVALALTYSRGCYAGIAVTAIVFLWMYNKKILGILLVIGTPIGITMLPQNMIDRILSMVNFADTSTSYRLQIYEGAFSMLKTFWLGGVGIGETAFNHIYPFFCVHGIVAPHSHSWFLQLMISFGIAGLAYFLILLFIYHRNVISTLHVLKKENRNRIWMIIFGAVLSGFLVQSIFDYTWYNYRVYLLFWIVISLGFTVYKLFGKEETQRD